MKFPIPNPSATQICYSFPQWQIITSGRIIRTRLNCYDEIYVNCLANGFADAFEQGYCVLYVVCDKGSIWATHIIKL